jgi:hypothetical protein
MQVSSVMRMAGMPTPASGSSRLGGAELGTAVEATLLPRGSWQQDINAHMLTPLAAFSSHE